MTKYVNPTYYYENVEVEDIILASGIIDNGTSSLGDIKGDKGSAQFNFSDIF